jgi:hypothetical protein
LDRAFVRFVIPSRVSWIVFALGTATFGVSVARADEPGDLEKAYGAYALHHYQEAESRLRALLVVKPGTPKDPDRIADVRMILAAVLLAEGNKDEAGALLEKLVLDKPDYQPDPLRVSLPALDALIDARHRLTDKLVAMQNQMVKEAQEHEAKAEAEKRQAAARLETMRRLASERIIVERHSRFEALLPFGVGQFQNRQVTLGVAFLTGESLLAAGSAIGFGLTLYNQSLASEAPQQQAGTAAGYQTRAEEAAIVGNIFVAGLAASAVVGIVQAQIAFVPEHVHIEHGPLPPSVASAAAGVSIAPVIGPGAIGLVGRF